MVMANQTLNQDGIEQCIVRMREALSAGDSAQAKKFMEKAQRMGASATKLQGVLKEFQQPPKKAPTPTSSATSSASSSSNFRQRTSAQRTSTASSSSFNGRTQEQSTSRSAAPEPPKKAYTTEEATLVRRILATKDFYQILNLNKEDKPSPDQIKRARNKLALKLHPDKTGAPNAEAAMQKVNKAYECLSDEKKKLSYDRFGHEPSASSSGGGEQHFHGDDIFEIFRQGFFGQQQRRGGNPNEVHGPPVWLLGVLLMFLFSSVSNLIHSQPSRKFSWNRDAYFPSPKLSRRLKAQYYVGANFDKEFPERGHQRKDIDHQVEIDYIRNTQSECEYEERRLWRKVMNARLKPNADDRNQEIARAKSQPRKSCEKLEEIKREFPKLYKAAVGNDDYGFGDL